jgi:phage terminase large subunit-like protein
MLKILKPNETDPAYLTDGSNHYLLAIHEQLSKLTDVGEKDLKKIAAKLELPLFGYRPLPQAQRFHRSTKLHKWCLGGNRSSKSHALAVETIWRATGLHPYRNDLKTPRSILYCTETGAMVSSVLWGKLNPAKNGLLKGINYKIIWQSPQFAIPNKIFFPDTGSEIYFRSYEMGRSSFQGVTYSDVCFDELPPYPVFEESISRIGPGEPLNFCAALTPLEPAAWLEEIVRNSPNEITDVFHFPLDDNRIDFGGFVPDKVIDNLIEQWPPEIRDTRRFGLFGGFTGTIYTSFNRELHVVSEQKEKKLFLKHGQIDDGMPVIGGIDWGGANPFVFIWATRIPALDNDWYIFDELYHDHKVLGGVLLKDLASKIDERNKKWGQYAFTRVWADHDPTDAREFTYLGIPSLKAKKDVTAGIEYMQTLFQPRRHLVNEYWPKGRPSIHIAERCKVLIQQLSKYRWAPGTDSRDPKDEPVKVDDHTCFVAGTKIETMNGEIPIEKIKEGDLILTRNGYRKCEKCILTNQASDVIMVVFSNGETLIGTGNHPVYIKNKGFTPIDLLSVGDELLTSEELWLSQLPTMGSSIEDIQNQSTGRTDFIINRRGLKEIQNICIEKSGKMPIIKKFQNTIMSTIRTIIQVIMTQPTSNYCMNVNICHCTAAPQSEKNCLEKQWPLLKNVQRLGIVLKREELGIVNKQRNAIKTENLLVKFVNIVKKNLKLWTLEKKLDFAVVNVGLTQEETVALMTKQELVPTVVKNSLVINMQGTDFVPVVVANLKPRSRPQPVYNLTVAEEHEYFANGVLVKNCDALRYICFGEKYLSAKSIPMEDIPGNKYIF